jgi:aconitate hydratase
MMTVAAMLKGRTVAAGVSLGIAPGSRQILRTLARNGALDDLIGAGARVM